MKYHNYFTYIITNSKRTVIYTGMTNNLEQRLTEHYINGGNKKSFAGKYNCYYLIYFERFQYVNQAIAREKQIKGWIREKKIALINSENSEWKFLNEEIMEWPPTDPSLRSG